MAESQEVEGLVHTLREVDDAAKMVAAEALSNLVGLDISENDEVAALIALAGGIPLLVELLRDGSANAKAAAARALGNIACNDASAVLIAEAGGVPLFVDLLLARTWTTRDAKSSAVMALGNLATNNDANKSLIAEAGGIPPLVQVLRNGSVMAKEDAARTLRNLARNNDANAVAVAVALGLEALVQLARSGHVTAENQWVVRDAALPAKRKAALVVAKLVSACVPDSVPRDIKAVIVSYFWLVVATHEPASSDEEPQESDEDDSESSAFDY